MRVRRKADKMTKEISRRSKGDEGKELDNQATEAYYAGRERRERLMWKPYNQQLDGFSLATW
jgi:hypothetical protein